MKKVLAFFGAFNPPTNAHIDLAELAMKTTERDGVIFVPSKCQYITGEQEKDFAFEDVFRLDMLNELALSRPWMMISRYDMEGASQPRSYETLCFLRDQGYEPTLLIGTDVLFKLEKEWLHVEQIAKEFGIACLTRSTLKFPEDIQDDAFLSPLLPYITFVQAPNDYLLRSSTGARTQFHIALESWTRLCSIVPPEVAAHLMRKLANVFLTGGNHEA